MNIAVLGAFEIKRRTHRAGFKVFLASLSTYATNVRVVCFNYSPDDLELRNLLAHYDVEAVDGVAYGDELSFVTVPHARFIAYRRWLREQQGVDFAVLCDTLDVLWQGPPDALSADRLLVAQENMTIQRCPFNRQWLREHFPEDFPSLSIHPVICCGVISGPVASLLAYLDVYLADAQARQWHLRRGHDTAVLTRYAYGRSEVTILPYRNGQCMHLGYAAPETVLFRDKRLICDGEIPTVVHQYNRHPQAMAELEAAWT